MKYFLLVLISINLCFASEKKFTVSGHIENEAKSITVLFKEYNTVQNIQTVLDTISVNNLGNFQADFNYEAGIYQIDFVGYRKINIAMEAGQKVNINLNIPSNENDEPAVELTGSRGAQLVFEYDRRQKAAYKKWLNPVRRNIRLAKEADKKELIPDLSEQEKKNLIVYKNELADYAKENFGNSIALFYAAIRLDPALHKDFMQNIAEKFNKTRSELTLTKKYNEKIERSKKTASGSIAPEIVLNNKDGKEIKLSDYRGNYVLLDFWAAWCNPCRIENLNYAKLYKKYKEKGFEIFAVSIDTNKKLWQNASKRDKINWINITDYKGWKTSSALTYNITAIPTNFLLDRNGKIIAKNIRGKDLKNKLAEIFN